MRTRPLVIAHGGNASEAPQNSLIAFQQALALGVDLIELDVNRTRDGHAVIFHGPDLKTTTGVEGQIYDLTLAEARVLDVGKWKDAAFEGERMMTFEEVLTFARGKVHLAVDLKCEKIIPRMVECVHEAGMVGEVAICGCDVSWAAQVRALEPALSVGLNMDRKMIALAADDPTEFRGAYLRQATGSNLSPLNINHRYVTQELVYEAHLRAVQVWAWTVDDPEDVERLIGLGVDAIYTNYPQRVKDLIGVLTD
jgi:glycerophosphoryl diester phosphodiesterase